MGSVLGGTSLAEVSSASTLTKPSEGSSSAAVEGTAALLSPYAATTSAAALAAAFAKSRSVDSRLILAFFLVGSLTGRDSASRHARFMRRAFFEMGGDDDRFVIIFMSAGVIMGVMVGSDGTMPIMDMEEEKSPECCERLLVLPPPIIEPNCILGLTSSRGPAMGVGGQFSISLLFAIDGVAGDTAIVEGPCWAAASALCWARTSRTDLLAESSLVKFRPPAEKLVAGDEEEAPPTPPSGPRPELEEEDAVLLLILLSPGRWAARTDRMAAARAVSRGDCCWSRPPRANPPPPPAFPGVADMEKDANASSLPPRVPPANRPYCLLVS
mmetsp:Transcript_25361/g.47176  ORF Transcript_25361/g.47176 Transcript_25361/m.47176 type:complete len:327 (+) Transcript_25361:1226-2206(+)